MKRPAARPRAAHEVALYEGLFERWMGKLEADLPMIFEVAKHARGPVLELGVGPGRVAIPLARKGKRVTGVDNARAMLDACRARLARESPTVRARVTLLEQDLASLDVPQESFGLALLPFNTLCHFHTLASQDAVVAGAARGLAPGGHLWLSVFQLDPARPYGVVRAEPSPLPGARAGETTEAFFQQTVDRAAQTTTARYWLDTIGADGRVTRQTLTLHLRYFHRFELERLLTAHDFTPVAWFGDFDGSELADGSPQIVVLARRR